jgi:hypothetical protein
MVVTSMDCLALVGQPMPQEPRFQQPLTLRRIAAAGNAQAQRTDAAVIVGVGRHQPGADVQPLLGLQEPRRHGLVGHLAQGKVLAPVLQRALGVRNELVQLTVVEPPTQRPCRMPMALSAVLRLALSWYSVG